MKSNWADSNHRTDVRDGYCETYIPTRHQCLPKTDWLFAAVEGKDKIRFVADTEEEVFKWLRKHNRVGKHLRVVRCHR